MAEFYQLPANLKPAADYDAKQAEFARAEAAKREATLKEMGIVPLDPYGSPVMDSLPGEESKPLPLPKPEPKPEPKPKPRATPRKDAKAAGATYYISGNPCLRGHFSKRLVVSGACIACQVLWREANKDKVRKINREYQQQKRARLIANRSQLDKP